MVLNKRMNKIIKTKEEIKKHKIEIGVVADGIAGFKTTQKILKGLRKNDKRRSD